MGKWFRRTPVDGDSTYKLSMELERIFKEDISAVNAGQNSKMSLTPPQKNCITVPQTTEASLPFAKSLVLKKYFKQ